MNNKPDNIKEIRTDIFKVHSTFLMNHNETITTGFLNHQQDKDVKRTHLFNGRYENIYLNESHIPELKYLKEEACLQASYILNTNKPGAGKLSTGYWFNYMPAGAITLPHRHDDDDELLSAVYYLSVPENSGDLILHIQNDALRIHPEAGMFVFFKPDVVHEVTENLSPHARLSIGINFGIKNE